MNQQKKNDEKRLADSRVTVSIKGKLAYLDFSRNP